MMRWTGFAAVCTAVVLAGCHKADPTASANPTGQVAANDSSSPEMPAEVKVPEGFHESPEGGAKTFSKKAGWAETETGNVVLLTSGHIPTTLPPLPSKDWSATTEVTPLDLAKKMDTAYRRLTGASSWALIHEILPEGEGQMKCRGKFATPGRFVVQYPVLEGSPAHLQDVEMRVNEGKTTEYRPDQGEANAFSPVKPYKAGGAMDGNEVLKAWPTESPRLAFSHFLEGKDVFVPLVQALNDKANGYQVTCQSRTVEDKGNRYVNYRILAERPADPSTNSPKIEFEIVIDPVHWVPVTMRSHVEPGGGKKATVVEWTSAWGPLKKVNPKDYALPGQRV